MLRLRNYSITLITLLLVFAGQTALAGSIEHATVAVSGFDVVSYHTEQEPVRGRGWFVSEHDGETYFLPARRIKSVSTIIPSSTFLPTVATAPMGSRWAKSSTPTRRPGGSWTASCTSISMPISKTNG